MTLPIPKYSKEDVLHVKELVDAGKYRAGHRPDYPLENVVEATRYVETGQKTGNVVLTSRRGTPMRAVVHDRYGPPEVLRIEEVERPVPKDDEVLVRVHATTVTRTDCGLRSAEFPITRYFTGVRRPKRRILGMELAGEVEAVGAAVTEFEPGDQVFGVKGFGAHAEYVCIREQGALAHKPASMSFEEAAAVCDGACTALSCLKGADLRQGRSILVYGATGSIGTAAVQLARHFGAVVTAVCNTKNVELVRSLGADAVIDYLQEDFTKNGQTYDVVFDAVGKHSFRRCRRSLKPGGIFVDTDLGFMCHVPILARAHPLDRGQEGDAGSSAVHEEGRPPPQGAHRGGRVPRSRRSQLPAGGRRRGDEIRRDGQKTGNVVLTVNEKRCGR